MIGDMALFPVSGKRGAGLYMIVDAQDAPKFFNYSVWLDCGGYACIKKGDRQVFAHHEIVGRIKGFPVDHINTIKLDNRRSNLRHVDQTINSLNPRARRAITKSGLNGVRWIASRKRWVATISVKGTSKQIGSFCDKNDAHEAYISYKKKISFGAGY